MLPAKQMVTIENIGMILWKPTIIGSYWKINQQFTISATNPLITNHDDIQQKCCQ
jgi:hypothetical protein